MPWRSFSASAKRLFIIDRRLESVNLLLNAPMLSPQLLHRFGIRCVLSFASEKAAMAVFSVTLAAIENPERFDGLLSGSRGRQQ